MPVYPGAPECQYRTTTATGLEPRHIGIHPPGADGKPPAGLSNGTDAVDAGGVGVATGGKAFTGPSLDIPFVS